MIKTIAIDDEPLALQLVSSYIKKTPTLELAGAFDNPIDAMEFLDANRITSYNVCYTKLLRDCFHFTHSCGFEITLIAPSVLSIKVFRAVSI